MRIGSLHVLLAALSIAKLPAREAALTPVAVIVNIGNPTIEMTSNRLRDVLFGTVREWPSRRRITIVQRDLESAVAISVLKSFLRMSVEEYDRYLLNAQFRGLEPPAIKTLLSDEGACDFVFNAPGAIGFISAESLDKTVCHAKVRVLHISGRADSPRSKQ